MLQRPPHGCGLFQVLVQDLTNGDEVPDGVAAADTIDKVFRLSYSGVDVSSTSVADVGDIAPGTDESAHGSGAVDDARVVVGVDRSGHGGHQVAEVRRSAHIL